MKWGGREEEGVGRNNTIGWSANWKDTTKCATYINNDNEPTESERIIANILHEKKSPPGCNNVVIADRVLISQQTLSPAARSEVPGCYAVCGHSSRRFGMSYCLRLHLKHPTSWHYDLSKRFELPAQCKSVTSPFAPK